MHTVKRVCFIGFGLLLFSLELQAQVVRVIDNKGTIANVNNNQVTTAATAPTSPLEGDIWFNNTDANNIVANVYDGSAWQVVPNNWLGNRTVHHSAATVLAITEALHNNADIHVESTGDLSITNTDVSDATNFYITNTTAVDRTLTFTGFAGAYLRNGGIVADVSSGGLTLKANTRYLAHVTVNGTDFYFNATEAGNGIDVVPLWKSSTNGGAYSINDIINYNGVLYRNLTASNTDTTPDSDATNWVAADAYLGNRTIHHNVTTTLAITEALHNNADIHVESTGDLSITNTDVSDATNFYITNTTAVDRTLSFTNFAGAYLRNGGAENDVSTGGLTLKANTRYLAHITVNGTDFYFNATEGGGGNTVINELVFDADSSDATAFIYVSLVINGDWKVIRYKKDDPNAEAEATETNNPTQTTQPTTLAACQLLTFI